MIEANVEPYPTQKRTGKKIRVARETGNLEAETGEDPKRPDIGRVVESYFNLPNEYSSSIIFSDFILTKRTCVCDSDHSGLEF